MSNKMSKNKIRRGIRLNGVSLPFGGISWEYTEEKRQECEAIQLLFILLESKRLITLPFSRNNRIPIEKDMEWCSLSTIDIKNQILNILFKYTLPLEIRDQLQSIIDLCNSLLEEISSLDSDNIIIANDGIQKRDYFLKLIDNFKKSLALHIKYLSDKYPKLILDNEKMSLLYYRLNSSQYTAFIYKENE